MILMTNLSLSDGGGTSMSGHVSVGPLRAYVKVDDRFIHFLQVH
jgi:hypothetical protein